MYIVVNLDYGPTMKNRNGRIVQESGEEPAFHKFKRKKLNLSECNEMNHFW